jgi:hypothetical protein
MRSSLRLKKQLVRAFRLFAIGSVLTASGGAAEQCDSLFKNPAMQVVAEENGDDFPF